MNMITRSARFRPVQRKMHGVTLIEMMISLTIGLLIIAGIGYAYLGSRQGFRSQDALSRMQEGARTAFEIMDKDIRMAGFTGCPRNTAASGDINILSSASDWDKNLIGQPLIGYEKASGAWSAFPAGVTGVVGNVLRGDALTVLRADNSQEFIVSTHDQASNPPQITLTANHDIKQGAILVAAKADCSRTTVFQNTKTCTINSSGSCGHAIIEHNATDPCTSGNSRKGLGRPVGTCPDGTPDTFGAGSRIFRLSAVTYYIRLTNPTSPDVPQPALYRQVLGTNSAEELIEGVQDMQLLYGEDTSPDNVIDKVDVYRTANNVADWSKVLGIRINLLMVSRQDEQGITTEPQQYALDMNGDGDVTDTGETVTPNDHLLRKVFTTTIAVKNRL
jgi:type IV pilus assembly protein PilW